MTYIVTAYVGLKTDDRKEAEKAAKNIFAGMWDLVPDLPDPVVSVVLFDETGPIHRIDRDKKLRRAK